VKIISTEDPVDASAGFDLLPAVRFQKLHLKDVENRCPPKTKTLGRLLRLRRAILDTNPTLVLGFKDMGAIQALQAMIGCRVPIIAIEHNNPDLQPMSPRNSRLRTFLYPRAASVVFLTEGAKNCFPVRIRAKAAVIPNAVIQPIDNFTPPAIGRDPNRKYVIGLGRLDPIQKRFDRLIEAFAMIAQRHPSWILEIWGEGSARESLTTQIQSLGIRDRAHLMGVTAESDAVVKSSDLLVLSSEFEGFGLVIAEALACGTPVVSFDCPFGPSEIVRHRVDGLLVPHRDVAALANAMSELMADDELRRSMSERGPEVTERFDFEDVMGKWNQLFTDVLELAH